MYSEPALLSRKQLGETGSAKERERPGSGKTEPVESTERRPFPHRGREKEKEKEREEREKPQWCQLYIQRGEPVSPLSFCHPFLLPIRRTGGGSEQSSNVVPGPTRPSSPQERACGALSVEPKDRTAREVLYAALAT